ncbi:unnamed protein product [Adineta ricciae]|uniref:Uncharacterized protein n=1 Tax=Adineta ricciae TaxID=249248 RepID=A0A813Y854_ADIRI|nr:unnamed protein product [Adineta ricciae]
MKVESVGLFNVLEKQSDAANFLRMKKDLRLNCIDKDCISACPCSYGYCWANTCSCFPCVPQTTLPVDETSKEQRRR